MTRPVKHRRRSPRAKQPANRRTTGRTTRKAGQPFIILTGLSGSGKSQAIRALEDLGYFCVDKDSRPGALVFNRTIGLRDSWAAKQAK